MEIQMPMYYVIRLIWIQSENATDHEAIYLQIKSFSSQ